MKLRTAAAHLLLCRRRRRWHRHPLLCCRRCRRARARGRCPGWVQWAQLARLAPPPGSSIPGHSSATARARPLRRHLPLRERSTRPPPRRAPHNATKSRRTKLQLWEGGAGGQAQLRSVLAGVSCRDGQGVRHCLKKRRSSPNDNGLPARHQVIRTLSLTTLRRTCGHSAGESGSNVAFAPRRPGAPR